MINALSSCFPVFVGVGMGFLYGYSFVMQQRSIFFHGNKLRGISFFIARIALIYITSSYLLRSPLIPSILGVLGFTIIFWSVILIQKAKFYEGH